MNTPTSIKGFNVPAPSFPYIEGLPLYPFANALWNALEERAALARRTLTWGSNPYPATGRGFCPVESHIHDHYLILRSFDTNLASVCGYYINQYQPISSNKETYWTFSALLEKATELLDISGDESFPSLYDSPNGRTLAPWAIQRAVMVSLLTTIGINTFGNYRITYMQGDSEKYPYPEQIYQAYQNAVANAVEYDEASASTNYLGGGILRDYLINTRSGTQIETRVHEVTRMKFQLKNDIAASWIPLIPQGIFTLYLRVNQYSTFYAYGSPFSLGENVLPVSLTQEENTASYIFYEKSFPTQPLYYDSANGWQTDTRQGQLIGNFANVFQYNMTWNES